MKITKQKFILAWGLLAGAVLVLGWFLIKQPVKPPITLTDIAHNDRIFYFDIKYTDQGYEPYSLEVPLGSKVNFKNESSLPMYTASDPHPTHTDYPEFDAGKDYGNGEIYSFQFKKAGMFGYHNHEKSIHRGIIKVTDPTSPSPNIDKTKEGQRQTRDKLLAMLDPKDPDSIFKLLDYIEARSSLSRDCHDMAHDLGHKAYELYGFSSAMTYNNPKRLGHPSVDDICAGGYMHGILEELFLHQPILKNNPKNVCAAIPSLNRDSCYHGVGHGLMFVTKRNARASLEICRKLESQLDTMRCYEGVWMEMFWGNTEHAGADSLGWTESDPLAPCVAAQGDEKPGCFLYAHLGYLRLHSKDFTGAVNLCVKNNLSPNDTQFCLKGIGITMMKHVTSHHLEETESLIAGQPYWNKYAYYAGVIGYARLSAVSEKDILNFCNELKTDRKVCEFVMQREPK